MATIENLREQLEQLKIIDEGAHKSALKHLKAQRALDAELKQGLITLEDYNKTVEKNEEALAGTTKEIVKTTEALHKKTKALDILKKGYNGLNSVVDKATGAFDSFTGASISSLTTVQGQIKAIGELGMKLQGLQVDLRRGTGFANRHTLAFDRLRDTYVDYGMTADELAGSLTSLSSKFSAFDSMTAANRDSITKTAAEYKNLGVEFDDFAALNERLRFSFGLMGKNAGLAANEIKRIATETGRPLSAVVSDLNDVGPELARFGAQGIEVFEGLAKRARSLGLGIKEAFNVTELFDTFEGAANIAGRLNAQLGLQLNSVEIMKASSEERLDILRSEFQLQGKNFETMGRRQKQMVAGILGQSIEDTAKILGDGMDISAFRAQESTQDQLIKSQDKVAAAMQRLTEDLPIVKAIGGMNTVIEAQTAGINALANNTDALAGALTGLAGLRMLGSVAGGALGMLGGAAALRFGPGALKSGGAAIARGAGGVMSRLRDPLGMSKQMKNLKVPGLEKSASKVAGGALAKTGAKAGARLIPGLGLAMSAGLAASRLSQGDYVGAGIDTLAGISGLVPGLGTAASVALMGANAARDMGAFSSSSSGTAPARSAGVPTSSGRSNGQIIVKELVVHSEITMDKDKFGKAVAKVMNVKLDPVRPN